jgi:hypothetical protein
MPERERRLRFLRDALRHHEVGRLKRPADAKGMIKGRDDARSDSFDETSAALLKHRAGRSQRTSPAFHCFVRLQSVTATARVTIRIVAKARNPGVVTVSRFASGCQMGIRLFSAFRPQHDPGDCPGFPVAWQAIMGGRRG